jgi:hypothetical protein
LRPSYVRAVSPFAIWFVALLAACSSGGYQPAIPDDGGGPVSPISGGAVPVSPAANPTDQPPAASSPGAQPTAGATASVALSGIPRHIATWAMDEYGGLSANASSSEVQRYVSYAEGGDGNDKAARDCSGSTACSSVFYLQTSLIDSSSVCRSYGNGFTNAASENWYVHRRGYSDFSHRLTGDRTINCNGNSVEVPIYVADGNVAGVQSYFRSYLQEHADTWDYVMLDQTQWDVVDQMFGPNGGFCPWEAGRYCTTSQELPTASSVVAEHGALATALAHKNGSPFKAFTNPIDGYVSQEISASNHLLGGLMENFVVDEGKLRPSMYGTALTLMKRADSTPDGKVVELNDGASPAGSSAQIAQRLVTTGVAWLGYSEGHTIVFPNLEDNTTGLAIWPEDMIYPANPLETMSSGPGDLEVGPSVWRREFEACFNDGTAVGPCAAIVNGSGSPITLKSAFFRESYGHVISLSGGDILSGGTMSLASTAARMNSSYIQPGEALLLFR